VDTLSLRSEFVRLASQPSVSFAKLCRRFGISRKTGYKWLQRYKAGDLDALEDRSRRPICSPNRCGPGIESAVTALRLKHPSWGGRKLRARLIALSVPDVPSAAAITNILHRHNLIDPLRSLQNRPLQRFERAEPNELWQMDFKGPVRTDAGKCHPLAVIDDHSRFNLVLQACPDQQGPTVQRHLTHALQYYGLPVAILCDNGPPWGAPSQLESYTTLSVWLMRLGVKVLHGRPYHPQTQGKQERFNRTLDIEVLTERFQHAPHCQKRFDAYREVYNWERPHEALGMEVPGKKYRASVRSYPATLPPIEYNSEDRVRKVKLNATIEIFGRRFKVGRAFIGLTVAVRPTTCDGIYQVFFCHQPVSKIDLRCKE
jgi:transposase InsO family protein